MGERWSAAQVATLAPDAAALTAAAKLANPRPWTGTGCLPDLVWGLCAGSGKNPYQTCVDLTGPAYSCSCPSRKFPCKHALALLLLWGGGTVPESGSPAEFAAAWRDARAERAGRRAAAPTGERDEAAAATRAAHRADRVAAGLTELQMWLRDQVRSGLSGASGGAPHTDVMAARMVDAQAPGIAAALRALGTVPASGDGWPGRLLGGYARLDLLARAHGRLDDLPPAFAATVRSHVGYQVRRDDVLAADGVTDDWDVLAVRDVLDGAIPTRRSYLRGRASGRYALVLAFSPNGDFSGNEDAFLVPGTSVRASAHFYAGRPPLRVVLGERGTAAACPAPAALDSVAAALDEWAATLALDPWTSDWPLVVRGTAAQSGPGWRFADISGASVPLLLGGADPWVLVAVSGGAPVTVAGEWTADGFRPLTCWHGDSAVPL